MDNVKAVFNNAWPYQKDKMNLPVRNLETALSFYENIMGFQIVLKKSEPQSIAILARDNIQIGLSENGGDPGQEGCFFEVDNVERALSELKSNGLKKEISDIDTERHGETSWKVFYVVAPDGLCYCLGEREK